MTAARRAAPRRGSYVLYGADGSGSAAIEVALLRCAAPYRIVRAATWEPDSALDELALVNPLRQVPTLQLPDGAVLTESAAMLMHLGLAHAASGLLPQPAAARDQALRGLVYIAANCYAAIGVFDHPERWLPKGGELMLKRLRLGARARLHAHWEMFADIFPPPESFHGGDAPGALDLLAAVVTQWCGARAHLAKQRPELAALLERVDHHPSVAPVFARHWPAEQSGAG